MRRLMTFILGMITGGAVLYAALHYHLIRASDGLHLVAKTKPQITATYVDIRSFRVADWTQHPALLQALLNANKPDLVEGAASDALQNGLDHLWERAGER